MRKKLFSRKLRSILSVALSLLMLIGTCLVVPTTAVAEGETITIDFENNTYSTATVAVEPVANVEGKDGQLTTVLSVKGNNSSQFRTEAVKTADGSYYALSAGDWMMTYDFKPISGSVYKAYLIYNWGITFGSLGSSDKTNYDSGRYVTDQNLITSTDTSKWHTNTIYFSVPYGGYTNLAFGGLDSGVSYIDNVVLTKISEDNVIVPPGPYAEEHDTITTFDAEVNTIASRDSMNGLYEQIGGNAFNYRNTLFEATTYKDNSVLAVCLWTGARHIRMNDTYQGLALHADKRYTLTFKWVNPNPEKDGVVGNESINKGTSGYDSGASIKLIANAGAFNGANYTTLATLLDVNDFSSAEGNTGEFVTKTVTFDVPAGADIMDIAISTKSSDGPAANRSNLNKDYIFLDDFKFTCKEIPLEPITIDFESHTEAGSGFYEIGTIAGENSEQTKAFYANANATVDFNESRYTQLKNNGNNISLKKGLYKFEYSYFITENASYVEGKPVLRFAETNGLAMPYDNGSVFGDNIILRNSQKGVWIKSSQYIELSENVTALGFGGIYIPRCIYVDNVKITPLEGLSTFNYSDGTVEVVEYNDKLTIPADSALNFSHWVNSKGETVQVGAPAVNNESYTAVSSDKIIYDFADFKETEAATKTEDGIRVEVEALTENYVEVPIETVSGKKIALNKNSGYIVRVNYKSMSVAGDNGSGAAGYVAEWWNPENPISAKKGNFPEILFSIAKQEYSAGGIPLKDMADYGLSGWTYFVTKDANTNLKLKFTAGNADLSEVFVKSIEIVAFDLDAAQADDNVINTTVEMFYNGTNEEVAINTNNKNSNIFGLKMPGMSAVYNYTDGTERSLMRFVTNYAYADGDVTQLKINDDISFPIYKRRILVGKENSGTDSYGIISSGDRKFTSSTPERDVKNDKNCWKIDTENGVISHSLMLKNIKKENKDNVYEIQSYLLLEVIDGRSYASWLDDCSQFNYLRFVETKAKVTAQNVYDGLSATANVAWYE